MNISLKYLQKRENKIKDLRKEGYNDLENFIERNGLSLSIAFRSDLFIIKNNYLNSDLYKYELSDRGKGLIRFDFNYQIYYYEPYNETTLYDILISKFLN